MRKPATMERRRFVKLLATSGAALLAAPLAKAAPAPGRRPAAPHGASHRQPAAALRKEIESQKRSLADALKVIRGYDLPPGSSPAFVFRALRARKGS